MIGVAFSDSFSKISREISFNVSIVDARIYSSYNDYVDVLSIEKDNKSIFSSDVIILNKHVDDQNENDHLDNNRSCEYASLGYTFVCSIALLCSTLCLNCIYPSEANGASLVSCGDRIALIKDDEMYYLTLMLTHVYTAINFRNVKCCFCIAKEAIYVYFIWC